MEEDFDEDNSVVIEIGEKHCKYGVGGGKTCTRLEPALVAKGKSGSGLNLPNRIYGEKAQRFLTDTSVDIHTLLKRGVVQNWRDFEEFLEFLLGSPDEDLVEQNFLFSAFRNDRRSNNEHLSQFMFETLNVKGLYVANPEVLAIASSGRSTGLCLSVGEGTSSVLPLHKGYVLKDGLKSQNLAGRDVTLQLKNHLYSDGITAHILHIRDLKEQHFVSATKCKATNEPIKQKDTTENSNDGFIEGFQAAEVLFDPCLRIEKEDSNPVVGLPKLVYDSVMRCEEEVRQDLLNAVILEGGTTMMQGFVERFTSELTALVGNSYKVKMIAPPERNKSVWLGGSILSSLPHMSQLWITKYEYAEYGPDIVHRLTY